MNPYVLRKGDKYWLYYGGGDAEGHRRICLATAPVEDVTAWTRHGVCLNLGVPGAFDANWTVLPHVIKVGNRWHLYYTGNCGHGKGLSAFPGIGLAISDDGIHFERHGSGPILAVSGKAGDPDRYGIAGGSVIRVDNEWRFYYTGCPTIGDEIFTDQQKIVCLATSNDGIHWQKQGALMTRIPDRDYVNVAAAGPVVWTEPASPIRTAGGTATSPGAERLLTDEASAKSDPVPSAPEAAARLFRMLYSAIGTRWGHYSICYAESDDGLTWRRGEAYGGDCVLAPEGNGWEKQMVEYPSVVAENGRLRMFYCGNGYGRSGIGTAMSGDTHVTGQ